MNERDRDLHRADHDQPRPGRVCLDEVLPAAQRQRPGHPLLQGVIRGLDEVAVQRAIAEGALETAAFMHDEDRCWQRPGPWLVRPELGRRCVGR